ncbi:MAG: YigZ family protein [Tyzzerella sp.]|nr:YigZ family protein [Tyzzerella sp.]
MLSQYKTVYCGGEAEIIEKKSRFIATVQPVKNEEEAIAFIERMKKKYWNATHNCSAYVLGEHFQIQRCSDDGEPSGTAGKPMLDVLLGEEIHDVVVVVTRYFGGTLLGTGGLVRAYSSSTKEGLLASKVITKMYGQKFSIETDYTGLGKIQYILGQRGLTILNSTYTDKVVLEVLLPEALIQGVLAEIREGTNGQAKMEQMEECYFANIDGEIRILSENSLHNP